MRIAKTDQTAQASSLSAWKHHWSLSKKRPSESDQTVDGRVEVRPCYTCSSCGKGWGGDIFVFLLFLNSNSPFSSSSSISLLLLIYPFSYIPFLLSLWDDTKWPINVDVSLTRNLITLRECINRSVHPLAALIRSLFYLFIYLFIFELRLRWVLRILRPIWVLAVRIGAATFENVPSVMCTQRRLKSDCASVQSN